MNPRTRTPEAASRPRRWMQSATLVGAGLLVGGALMAASGASAATEDDTATSQTEEAVPSETEAPVDQTQPQRTDEELLTGDAASQVEAAVLAAYPGATIDRLETDSDGTYEAHLTTADGDRVTVELGEDFVITGEEAGGGRGGRGGPGGDCADDATTDDGATSDSATDDSATEDSTPEG
ncbi:MAG: hypothetical protein JWP95_377 [Actinotalea sp.]|nr:hypothetical protein [Actinotalea sp.]